MKALAAFLPSLVELKGRAKLNSPPMSIYYLKSIINNIDDVSCEVLDPQEHILKIFLKNCKNVQKIHDTIINTFISKIDDFDVVLFSCNTFNWASTKIIIEAIKNYDPDKKIILGGIHASYYYKHIMKTLPVDFIITGLEMNSVIEVFDYLKGNSNMTFSSNIITKNNHQTSTYNPLKNTEKFSPSILPDFSTISLNHLYQFIPIQASVGCQNGCLFCSIMAKHNWEEVDTEIIIKNMSYIIENYGQRFIEKSILFTDDCFTTDVNRSIDILNKCHSAFPSYTYFIEARVNDIVKSNLLETIPADIIKGIQVGVECGYDEGLKKIFKGTTVDNLLKCCEKIKANGYKDKVMLSFIIGFPWEYKKEIDMTLDTIEKITLEYDIHCNINYLILLPSKLWEKKEDYGIKCSESVFDKLECFEKNDFFNLSHPNLDYETLVHVKDRISYMMSKGLKVTLQSDHLSL
ncbi:B12-binding domain-containing radical SAM protein [Tissierella praeacuta]|uniref:B12-binding domain-containing radical SAM protein n=1 Tax=Tissierella praeacuta TaxID=43131 RepID=UPI002FD923FC